MLLLRLYYFCRINACRSQYFCQDINSRKEGYNQEDTDPKERTVVVEPDNPILQYSVRYHPYNREDEEGGNQQ